MVAKVCIPFGKTLHMRWQNIAQGMAKYCVLMHNCIGAFSSTSAL